MLQEVCQIGYSRRLRWTQIGHDRDRVVRTAKSLNHMYALQIRCPRSALLVAKNCPKAFKFLQQKTIYAAAIVQTIVYPNHSSKGYILKSCASKYLIRCGIADSIFCLSFIDIRSDRYLTAKYGR